MKTNLISFTVIVLMLPLGIFGQDVSFIYDNAGNRTDRQVIYLKTEAQTNDSTIINDPGQKEELIELSCNLDNIEISIYPNPTAGSIQLNLNQLPENGEYLITDAAGNVIIRKLLQSTHNTIDLNDRPNGIYVLNISVDNQKRSWKIVKL